MWLAGGREVGGDEGGVSLILEPVERPGFCLRGLGETWRD